ncbi:CHY zinc finger protein [Halovivax limisalsi]|uniref:CHY zinc finger protein n=1 Tax=Halovivax limisalsi TaxID=1453760 RepID=UPI001FFD35BB|nr:CHY zinc finger protein [Halovivax limisalsi]
MIDVGGVTVDGVGLDDATRCAHYDSPRDVVALRFGCCDTYFACHRCHDERTEHESAPWPRSRFDEPAVLCGACGSQFTPPTYVEADHRCPACASPFNPDCASHRDLYFEPED